MSLALYSPDFFKIIHDKLKEYCKDYYNGMVRVDCDEDCSEGCDGDHGYYELPVKFPNLFNGKEDQINKL